jgi:kynurenine formamidase|tara:strand:+ start:379 stop:1311 length:933 start_codon:yes stop_codon:yes gene_type:complete
MKKILLTIFFCINLSILNADECRTSKWGPQDEIGSANLITPDSVLKASKLIKYGKTYSLGITIDSETPAYPPRSLSLQVVQPTQQFGVLGLPNSTYNDDVFQGWFGIGSQIDGLGHIGTTDAIFYNCYDGKEFAQITGLTKLGIEKIPPIVARGVVIDIAGHLGMTHLEKGATFDLKVLKEAAKSQKIEIQKGDVVLLHTGWTDAKFESEPVEWGSGAPGIHPDIARYLASMEVVAVGADTWSLDVVPPMIANEPYPSHGILLQENGIYILETMNTGPLVKDGVTEFLFVLGQAKIKGAVQMIINPIAIR